MVLGLGVDFEHIYQTPAYRSLNGRPKIPFDLDDATEQILELFDQADVSVTFFVVAEVAKNHPDLIQRIVSQGHEIASHTVTHPSLPTLSTSDICHEIRESKMILERITGTTVSGFRAPTCQLDDRVYNELSKADYGYSSSVMPSVPIPGFYTDDYGFNKSTSIVTENGIITEYPLAVSPFASLPISGAWTRLLGRRFLLKSVRNLLAADRPVLTYVHPWEFAELQDTPLPIRNRIRTGKWLRKTYEKLLEVDAECVTVSELSKRSQPQSKYEIPL